MIINETVLPPKLLLALNGRGTYPELENLFEDFFNRQGDPTDIHFNKELKVKYAHNEIFCEIRNLGAHSRRSFGKLQNYGISKRVEMVKKLQALRNSRNKSLFNHESLRSAVPMALAECITVGKQKPTVFANFSPLYKSDRGFLQYWAHHRGLKGFGVPVDDKELIELAIMSRIGSLEYATDELQRDKQFLAHLISVHDTVLAILPTEFRQDEKFLLSVGKDGNEELMRYAHSTVYEKFGLKYPGQKGRNTKSWADLYKALEINHSKLTLETVIEPRIESVEVVQARKKANRTL